MQSESSAVLITPYALALITAVGPPDWPKMQAPTKEELNKLSLDFARYKERWDKLARSIQTVNKDVESVYITTDKISKKFESISSVNIDKLTNKE